MWRVVFLKRKMMKGEKDDGKADQPIMKVLKKNKKRADERAREERK